MWDILPFQMFPSSFFSIRAMCYILLILHLFSKPSFIWLESLQLTHFSLLRSIFIITAFLAELLLGRFWNQEPIKVRKNPVILKFSKSLSRSCPLRLWRFSSCWKDHRVPFPHLKKKKKKEVRQHCYLFYQILRERWRFYGKRTREIFWSLTVGRARLLSIALQTHS